jgi:hypothetical protein
MKKPRAGRKGSDARNHESLVERVAVSILAPGRRFNAPRVRVNAAQDKAPPSLARKGVAAGAGAFLDPCP